MAPAPSARFNQTLARIAQTKPELFLQQAVQLNPIAFRVLANYGERASPIDLDGLQEMLATATGNQFRWVADTLQPLSRNAGQVIFSGIVEANTAVREYDPQYVQQHMRVLAANLFMDNGDDSIWRVVDSGESGEKYLVQSVKENFAELLQSRLAHKSGQVLSSSFSGITPACGDYIQYYDPDQSALAWGYAIIADDQITVVERGSGKPKKIIPAHVVICCDGGSLEAKYNVAQRIATDCQQMAIATDSITPSALNDFIDYIRQLYAGTDFFTAWEQAIRSRARSQVGNLSTMQN